MSSKSDLKISAQDERLGPFGQAAMVMLGSLFPQIYIACVVSHPTFNDSLRANISPQFERGKFFVASIVEQPGGSGDYISDLSCFDASQDVEELLDRYRYENAIFADNGLSTLTAWAQGEYAIVAFKKSLVNEYAGWLEAMRDFGVLYEIV